MISLISLGALAMSAASLYVGVGLGEGGADRLQSQWGLLPKVGLWTQVQQAQPADSWAT